MGGATQPGAGNPHRPVISIHAPRGGSDFSSRTGLSGSIDFNPRSPWGERPSIKVKDKPKNQFQSTLPVGGATSRQKHTGGSKIISIHAPRGGSDVIKRTNYRNLTNFNPRSPWGERHSLQAVLQKSSIFQSTLPVGGATFLGNSLLRRTYHFNPRSPWGERPERGTAIATP